MLVGWVSSGSSWGCLRWKVFDLKIVTSNNDGERGWRQEAGNQVFDHILVVILKSLAEQNGQQKMLQISVESFFKSNIKEFSQNVQSTKNTVDGGMVLVFSRWKIRRNPSYQIPENPACAMSKLARELASILVPMAEGHLKTAFISL